MKITGINSLKTLSVSVILLAGASACQQKPLVEMPSENISEEVRTTLDSLAQETATVKADTNYIFYGRDTLLLWSDFAKKPLRYLKNIDAESKSNVPTTVVGRHTVLIPSRVGNTTVMRQHVRVDREPDYIETKTVISSNKILTRDSVAMYIPVEYYGKSNPKVEEVKAKQNKD